MLRYLRRRKAMKVAKNSMTGPGRLIGAEGLRVFFDFALRPLGNICGLIDISIVSFIQDGRRHAFNLHALCCMSGGRQSLDVCVCHFNLQSDAFSRLGGRRARI